MKHFILTAIVAISFIFTGTSFASSTPYNILNMGEFLDSSYFGAAHEVVTDLNLSGAWQYTAIAHESGNWNITEEGTPGATFSTNDYSNWGLWDQVNFDTDNIFFSDSDGPYDVALNPNPSSSHFKVFQTTESTMLDYLDNDVYLASGTYVVGFNDNGDSANNDADFDDMIVAIAPVPEPGTIILLGAGLIGLAVARRKAQS